MPCAGLLGPVEYQQRGAVHVNDSRDEKLF